MRSVTAQSPAPIPARIGWEADVYALQSFIATARRGGGALVLVGEPGVGKSALLGTAAAHARASGFCVAAVAGTESDAIRPFAALARLGRLLSGSGSFPLMYEKSSVTAADVPDDLPLATPTAVLSAIREGSFADPLLIIVDDAQWIDHPSAQVLAFVARRLRGSRAGVLVATRPDNGLLSARSRLPTRHLLGQTDQAAMYPLAEQRAVSPALPAMPSISAAAPSQSGPRAAGDALCTRTAEACQSFESGDLVAAYRILTDALKRFGPTAEGESLGRTLIMLQSLCHIAGSDTMWRGFQTAIAQLGHRVSRALRILVEIRVRSPMISRELLTELGSAADALPVENDSTLILHVAAAAVALDQGASCTFSLGRVVEGSSSRGSVWSGMTATCLLAEIGGAAGDTARVQALADDVLRQKRPTHCLPHAMLLRSLLALSTAAVGNRSAVHSLTQQALSWAGPARAYTVMRTAHWALGRQELGTPNHDAAYRHFVAMSGDDGVESLVERQPAVLFDLVEATIGSGRRDVARACVARARTGVSSRWDLIAEGARALADEWDPIAAFERASALPQIDRWPFDLARIKLAYGEYLRRSGAVDAAREQLARALDTFLVLDARLWIVRTARQLRLAGAAVAGIGIPREALTGQEDRIAALAASGLTNRDIARRTQLSERTIASHLRRVFRKTGVTSRAQLRDALAAGLEQG